VCVRPGVVSCVVELRGAATDLLHPVVRRPPTASTPAVPTTASPSAAWCPTPRTSSASSSDDAQAVIQQASLLGQAVLGDRAGKRARRAQVLGGKELALPPRCASFAGYSLHAGVGFKATDRAGLERLCRYILRPPLAKDRLQRHDDGNDLSGSCRRERSVAR
jgi:hypothetical protein